MRPSHRLSFMLLAVFLAGCATVPVTGRRQLALVSQNDLVSMSADSYRKLLSEKKLSQDAGKIAMVNRVGDSIARAAEDFMRGRGMADRVKDFQWEFNLIEDDETVNAFAMPGGKIAVYTGILPVTRDENGLATVLSHEVAHVLANHSGERLSHYLLVQLGGLTLSTALREKSDQTRKWSMVAYGLGSTVGVILPYSRTHESEADHIGLVIMAKAGYDPRRAVDFWQRMAEEGKARPPVFLSTHPSPENRIEAIKRELPEVMPYYRE